MDATNEARTANIPPARVYFLVSKTSSVYFIDIDNTMHIQTSKQATHSWERNIYQITYICALQNLFE
jgi:hypothetical protein